MDGLSELSDAALLAPGDRAGERFAVLYRRHLPVVLRFVLRRVGGDRELAADLTAEVFAAALAARGQFDPARGEARAWLCTIAAHMAIDSARRGRIEDEARRRLGMEPIALFDDDLARVDELASPDVTAEALEAEVASLAPETAQAIFLRVVDGRGYDEIALSGRAPPAAPVPARNAWPAPRPG